MEFLWQSPSLSWIIFCTKCSLAGSFTNKLKLLDLLYSISQNSTCLWSYLFVNNELQNNCDSYCMEYWICLRQPISFGFFCRIIRIQRMPINILKIPKILRRLSCLFYRIYLEDLPILVQTVSISHLIGITFLIRFQWF